MSFDPTENVPPFPTTTLPGWLEAMVTATAAAHQVPADLPGVLTLAALATVCAGRVQVSPKAGWVEGANLYAAVAMPPGTGKSPVFSVIMKPIGDAEELLQADAGAAFAAAKTRREIAEKRAAHLRTEASRTADPLERERLTADASAEAAEAGRHEYYMPRLLADDVTPETLATLLYEQSGRIAIISDEGGVFAQMLGRYSGGVANLDTYLKAHSGGRILVDRRVRSERIDEPRLTLGLAVQPQLRACT